MGKILPVFTFIILACGCGSMREGTTGSIKGDILTAEEIATTPALNAYEAISLKRPFFLKSRGMRSLHEVPSSPAGQTVDYPVVYIDRMYYGDLESLRNISVKAIREIHYLDFNAATIQFGTGHTGGIILVLTRQ